ncbi:hypothetical protein NHX12_029838 [Muraenolepis orangiensis]|uniref:C2H2-type domain-containing protein n=1 Tax=Muraenolepis orangiensis TaxID=630683 RepID=A0A9Q0E921_9TELE|nr:hypothetical protein NHX12_029838 [Muraenolepis orangiensis]
MTKLELLNVFLNERLTAVAEDVFKAIRSTVEEYQDEILRFREENERLKRLLDVAVQRMVLHSAQTCEDKRTAGPPRPVDPTPGPAPWRAIKEEREEEERPIGVHQHDTRTSISIFSGDSDDQMERPHVSGGDLSPIQPLYDAVSDFLPTHDLNEVKSEHFREESRDHQALDGLAAFSNFQLMQSDSGVDPSHSGVRTHGGPNVSSDKERDGGGAGPPGGGANGGLSSLRPLRPPRPPRASYQSQNLQKVHVCRECGKGFSFACQLGVHMRWHTKEKPYGCTVCRKSFTTVGMLRRHHRIHTGEKPFRCHVCGKCFNQSAHLNTHFRLHAGESARWARTVPHS